MFSLSEDITGAYKRADNMYKNLIRMFPTSPVLLRSYATFVEDMGSEYMQAARLNELADEIDYEKKQTGNKPGEFSSDSSEVLSVLGGQAQSLGSSEEGSVSTHSRGSAKTTFRKRNIARKLASISFYMRAAPR